jgi:hypothetical protein
MITYIYKLIFHEDVLTNGDDEFDVVVLATNHDGCDALYTILGFTHPLLSEEKVSITIPTQLVANPFVSYVKVVRLYIEEEALCGLHYSKYEGL